MTSSCSLAITLFDIWISSVKQVWVQPKLMNVSSLWWLLWDFKSPPLDCMFNSLFSLTKTNSALLSLCESISRIMAMRKACPCHDDILISIMPHSHRQNTTLCQMFDKHVCQVSRDVRTMAKCTGAQYRFIWYYFTDIVSIRSNTEGSLLTKLKEVLHSDL